MGRPLLTIKNLSAGYDSERTVLSGFSLELSEHEVVGLIGLNGGSEKRKHSSNTCFTAACSLPAGSNAAEIREALRPPVPRKNIGISVFYGLQD